MEKNNNKNSNLKFFVIVILLIIIILILLFFRRYGHIENDYYLIPTGNVDVFDIDVDCGCNKCSEVIPVFDEDNNILGRVYVDDKNGNYLYQQKLEIFKNAAFQYRNKIAPGVSNTYNFVAHNSTNIDLNYNIKFVEKSEYHINLKYRLRRNNKYIVGDANTWVTASELDTALFNIKSGKSDVYSLDWLWPYEGGVDDEDTLAGEKMMSEYKLNIKVNFKQA